MAFKLLRAGLPITVLGRDIAKNLKNLLKKAIKDSSATTKALLADITIWQNAELEKVSGRPQREEAIRDRTESMRAICENVRTLNEALNTVDQIFMREGRIILGTGHKAKGLEWDYVIHLDEWRIPSKFAQQAAASGNDSAMMQEKNLKYVIETRTKDNLAFANLENWNEA
jgi:superfamily I DNA/RNA helicase